MLNLTKTIDEIRSEVFEHIEDVQDELAAAGYLPTRLNLNRGIVRGLLEIYSWTSWQLYEFLAFVQKQATVQTATGEWLDRWAADVDISRKAASRAEGLVTFTRDPDFSGNITIPAGKTVRTATDAYGKQYRYTVTTETVLESGNNTVQVPVISEEYGAKTNATSGAICEIVTPINNIVSVTNSADWLTKEAVDEESDEALRTRYKLAWQARSGVVAAAYKAAAMSVPGVVDVAILDNHPRGQGTIDIIVQGSSGTATESLLNAVEAAIADEIVINDDVEVAAVTPVTVNISLEIEYLTGSSTEISAKAEAAIRSCFYSSGSGTGFGIGEDVIRDRISAKIINITGVKRIIWSAPSGDVTISASSIASLGSLTITMTQVSEA